MTVRSSVGFTVLSLLLLTTARLHAQTWVAQPINPTNVPGLWCIAMFDSGRGIAVGGAAVSTGLSGVVRKNTGAVTWQNVATANFSPALSNSFPFWSGACARKNTGTAWVCGSNAKIYKSSDYGVSWIEKNNGISGSQSFFDIYFKSLTEGMAVGSNGMAYYTTNGGDTWVVQSTGTTSNLYAAHCAGSVWFVSGSNNTMLKFSPPSTWTDISAALPPGSAFSLIEGLQFLDDQTGTFSGYNSAGPSHVFRTTNGGNSWAPFPTDPPINGSFNAFSSIFFFNASAGWAANAFDPIGFTADGGVSWQAHTPQGSGTGAITRLDFVSFQQGWASGGAIGGGPIPLGFILKFTGPPPAPDISKSPISLDFGTVQCTAKKDTIINIQNNGIADLIIPAGGVTFTKTDFQLVSPALPMTLIPGQVRQMTIRWTPPSSTFGALSNDTMHIQSNDAAHPVWKVRLDGLKLFSSGTPVPASLPFPSVCGASFSDTSITISPVGNANPTFISFAHESGDTGVSLVSPPPGTVLAGPTQFTFRYRPGKLGNVNGVYRLTIGDPNCPEALLLPFSASYRRNRLTVTPAVFDFGDVCAGSTKDRTITLSNINNNTGAVVQAREFVSGSDVFPNAYSGPFGPILPDSSGLYTVRYSPSQNDTGIVTGTYRLILGPCADTVEYTLRARAVTLSMTTIPLGIIRLGPISVGQQTQQSVAFTNTSTSTIRIKALAVVPPTPSLTLTSMPTLPLSLDPGKSSSVTVRYDPTKLETITASLCVIWDDPCNDSLCLPISAQATETPRISTLSAFNLGTQACKSARIDSFLVRNTGPGPLNLQSFTLEGPQKNYFRVIRPPQATLVPAGDSAFIVVEYSSPVEQASTATLIISHNDASANNETRIALSGQTTITELVISGDTSTALVTCVRNSVKRSITIRNSSPRAVTISQIALAGNIASFSELSQALPATVQPSGSVSITIDFHPVAPGTFTTQLRVLATHCPDTLVVSFTGIAKSSPVAFSPSPVNFGTVSIGSSTTRNVQVSNAGFETVTIRELFFDPPRPGVSFDATPALPATLNSGQFIQVTVRYNPLSAGSLFTNLAVGTSTPCDDTVRVPVLGLARADGISFDRDSLHLLPDPCGTAGACDTVVLMNNSTRTVIVSDISIDPVGSFFIGSNVPLPLTLTTGQSQIILVCIDGAFTGTRTGTLHVASNDPGTPDLILPLSAERDSISLAARAEALDFGVLPVCSEITTLTAFIDNTGSAADTLDVVHAPGPPFSFVTVFPVAIQSGTAFALDVVFASTNTGSFSDTIRLRSRRCGREIVIVLRGMREAENARLTPSPLVFPSVSVGGSSTLPVTAMNLNLPAMRIAAVDVIPAGTFIFSGTLPQTIGQGGSTALPIRFAPTASGTASATVCVIFDMPCVDTICIQVTGSTGDGLLFSPATLSFDSLAQCQEQIFADTLRNATSTTVSLTSSLVIGSGAAAFTLLDPVTPGETILANAVRTFTIRFRPTSSSDGNVTATLRITTSDPALPQADLLLEGTRITQSLPSPLLAAFGTIPSGSPSQRTVWVRNPGSAAFTIQSISFPPEVSITPPPPMTIARGDSIQLTVSLTPASPGAIVRTAWLRITEPCMDSIRLDISAAAGGGIGIFAENPGIVPNCSDTTVRVVVRNTFGQTGSVNGVSISGADAARFTVVSPTSFPVALPANDSIDVRILCTPDASVSRSYAASCDVTISGIPLPNLYSAILAVDAREPSPVLVSTVDFGPVSINTTSPDQTAVLRNTLPFAIRITDIRMTNALFTLRSVSRLLPTVLLPNDTLSASLTFSPVNAGTFDGLHLEVISDAPCMGSGSYPIAAQGIDDLQYVTLSIPEIEGKLDERIRIPIVVSSKDTAAGAASWISWGGSLRYNPSMLYVLGIVNEGTMSSSMGISGIVSVPGTLELMAVGSAPPSGSGTLVFVECLVLLGDDISSTLSLSPGFDFTSGRVRVQSRQDGLFRLKGYCDDDRKRLVNDRWGFTLHQNAPNPFNPSTILRYELEQDGYAELIINDVMGRFVTRLASGFHTAGTHTVTFDATDMPSGPYIAMLRTLTSSTSIKMLLTR